MQHIVGSILSSAQIDAKIVRYVSIENAIYYAENNPSIVAFVPESPESVLLSLFDSFILVT